LRGEFVDVGNTRLYYYASGTRGGGEPVLFVHGFPTSSHLWARVVPLVPPGHRVVVPDLLGFGRSDPPPRGATAGTLTVDAHARRLTDLVDVLGISTLCLVGHGIGAAIALEMARANPKRVTRLVLVSPVFSLVQSTVAHRALRIILPLARLVPASWTLGVLHRRLARLYRGSSTHDQPIDHYLRPFSGPGGVGTLVAHVRGLAPSPARSLQRQGVPPSQASLRVTIVRGADDVLLSRDGAENVRAQLAGRSVAEISGGHFCPEESPEQLAQVLRRDLMS